MHNNRIVTEQRLLWNKVCGLLSYFGISGLFSTLKETTALDGKVIRNSCSCGDSQEVSSSVFNFYHALISNEPEASIKSFGDGACHFKRYTFILALSAMALKFKMDI